MYYKEHLLAGVFIQEEEVIKVMVMMEVLWGSLIGWIVIVFIIMIGIWVLIGNIYLVSCLDYEFCLIEYIMLCK